MKSDRKNNLAEGTSVNQALRSIHGSANKASSTKEGPRAKPAAPAERQVP